jgi:hypothetical protein
LIAVVLNPNVNLRSKYIHQYLICIKENGDMEETQTNYLQNKPVHGLIEVVAYVA